MFIFLTCLPAIAQKRAMNWYFGKNVGINFSANGTSSSLTNGAQVTNEACASISDISGNLLFYSNGNTVYNHEHSIMSNGSGIFGIPTATQGALIIPQPGSKSKYYLFTLKDTNNNLFNLNYSVIDMSLNNGLGAVTSVKNKLLLTGVSERLAATYNQNGSGIWVMVRSGSSALFHAFSLTSSGISTNSVTSSVGSSTSSAWRVQSGQMKFSPDGGYLAWACNSDQFVELLRFNKGDGTLESWSRKIVYSGYRFPYGIEFSPDVSKIYVSCAATGLFQYELAYAVNESLFQLSEVEITSSSDFSAFALQLGPNGKIYCAGGLTYGSKAPGVHVINAPNLSINQLDFQVSAHTFSGTGIACWDGLPSFLSNYFVDKKIVSSDTCIGDSTSFAYLLELGDSIMWNFGDPKSSMNTSTIASPKHVFSNAGTFDISLIIYNGDGADTIISSININSLPSFNLGRDTTICSGTQFLLNPGLTNAYYQWQDGKTTPVYVVKESATYSVRVERFGCVASDTIVIKVDKPLVSIISTTASPCENNNAFNFSLSQLDRVATLIWNFGDGTNSTARQTSHSYQAAGAYEVNLETINENGCSAKSTKSIEVLSVVSASIDINAENQCFDKHQFEVSFPDAGNSQLKTYFFEFSDGKRTLNGPTKHVFSSKGKKSISLITISNAGCKDTLTKELNIYPSPELKFTIDSSAHCFKTNAIILQDLSSSTNGNIQSRSFSSEGMKFTGNQAVFTYSAPGEYSINAWIQDEMGCQANQTSIVHIDPNPKTNFEVAVGNCIGTKPIQLTNSTLISKGEIGSYEWDFGDGTKSTGFEPIKQYGAASRYSIKLTATSLAGCSQNVSKEVVTFDIPEASIRATDFEPCLNENRLDLINTSTGNGVDLLNYEWLIEGKAYTSKDVSGLQFTTPGPKLVIMRVSSDKGCFDEIQTTFMVLPSPSVAFVVNEPEQCEEDNKFTALNSSLNPISPIVQTSWTLSDGRSFDASNIDFSFPEYGTYGITLSLTNQAGCISEFKSNVLVHPQPSASFEAEEVCQSAPMKFTNTSTIALGSIESSWWNFGDKRTTDISNPSHRYDKEGEYAVYLQVKSNKGCENFVLGKVSVLAEPFTEYTYRKYGYMQSVSETVYEFESAETNPTAIITWFVNGQKKFTGRVAYIGFTDTGHHIVTMIVETDAGCPGTSSKQLFVAPPFELFMPTGFTPNGDGKNDILLPVGDNYINEFEMVIVNRWGTVMFKSTSSIEGWDGKFAGDMAQPGAYVYLIRLVDIEGAEWKYQGTVVLLQ